MALLAGLRETVDLPRPARRRWGTLASSVPRGIMVRGGSPLRWPAGVRIQSESCGINIEVVEADCAATNLTDTTEFGDTTEFDSLVGWATRWCSTQSGRGSELTPAAQRIVDEQVGFAVARELMSGTVNPSLKSTATVVTTSAALPAIQALVLMEESIAAAAGNIEALIHVSPAMLERLYHDDGIFREGDSWYTATGQVVIGDAGYDGGEPDSEDPVADDEEYIYATGPVAWDYGPEQAFDPTDLGTAYERRNQLVGRAQRPFLALFDPDCLVLAVWAKTF